MRVLSVFLGGALATPYWKTSLFLSFSSPEMHGLLNNRFLLRLSQYIRTFYLKPHLWVITDVCLMFSLSSLSFFKYLMDTGASFAPLPLGGASVLSFWVRWACSPGEHRIESLPAFLTAAHPGRPPFPLPVLTPAVLWVSTVVGNYCCSGS